MKRSCPLFASGRAAMVSALLLTLPAVGRAVEIIVEPPMPTAGDRTQIVVHGVIYPPSGPTSFAPCMNVSCWQVDGRAFAIGVCDYSSGLSSSHRGDGPPGAVMYGEIGRSDLGTLAAGHYVVRATIYDGVSSSPRTETMSFDVADSGPDNGNAPYRLESLGPSPARGTFSVAAALGSDSPATVAVYDIQGRLITSVNLEATGPRRQVVRFGADHPLPADVYFVRLTQDRHVLQLKQVVVW